MKKRFIGFGLLALLGLALAQATYSFTINGKSAKLETLEKNGKVFVEAQTFAKALGASVSFDKNKRSFVIVSGSQNAVGAVQGTNQQAGGEGLIGKTYTLGKVSNALNFTLTSLEYSLIPVTIDTQGYAPKANEKFLVLHFTVQNPQKQASSSVNYSSFKMTAIDSKDINHVFDSYYAREGTTTNYNAALKPAQKINLFAFVPVPASGSIPKLIIERNDGSPVVRYDLRGKVKSLGAPFADPTDPSGSSALTEVPAQAGSFYPASSLGIKLETVVFSSEKMDGRVPDDGKRYFIATFAIKNILGASANPINFSYSNFKFELRDAEGDKQIFDGYLIKATRDERAESSLKSGDEYRFRVYFALPNDLTAKTLAVSEGESRVYSFDVSSAK